MRTVFGAAVFVSIALLFSGCDSPQYQMINGSDGALYRFNKKTGELSMVMEGKKVVRLAEGLKSEIIKEPPAALLERPVKWNELKYPGKDLKVHLETVWREGKLCYKLTAYPYKSLEKIFNKKKQDYIYSLMKPGFTVEFIDKNGFLVKEIKITLWNMTKVGSDGATKELILNAQIDCSRQSYGSIGGYAVKWALEPDMIEDDIDEKK